MNIKEANHVIYKALNSKNEILRMEAQIALVRLTDEDPFSFLFQLETTFFPMGTDHTSRADNSARSSGT